MQWAYYIALGGNGFPSTSSAFDPTLYRNITPIANGTTQIVDVPYTTDALGNATFYNKASEPLANFFIDHRGYFYPPQTGNYIFDYNYIDDAAFLWVGAVAYSGWNSTNRNLYGNWQNFGLPVSVYLVKNTLVPIRVAMGQGAGGGGLNLDIYAPDGETVITSNTSSNVGTASPYFVAFSCDGSAPAYPPWGSE